MQPTDSLLYLLSVTSLFEPAQFAANITMCSLHKAAYFKVKNLCVLDCGYSHIMDTAISHKKNNVKPSCTAEDHARWN